uniref:Uncharacterized protein n=1 Tax=Rhizophora mucronata TaxID=61149 RepID=A0A2P2NG33_RHIMU
MARLASFCVPRKKKRSRSVRGLIERMEIEKTEESGENGRKKGV